MPNASGKIEGTTHASASASRWTRWRCSSGPVKRTCSWIRERLELRAVVAEADDDRPRIEPPKRFEQDVDALVPEQLPEVDDRRPLPPRGTPPVAPHSASSGRRSLALSGIRRIAPGLGEQALQAPPRAASDATRRRRPRAAPRGRGRPDRIPPRAPLAMCADPTNTASAPASASLPHDPSSGRPRIEYSSSEP